MFGDVSYSGDPRARMSTKTDLIGPEICGNSTCLLAPTPWIYRSLSKQGQTEYRKTFNRKHIH